MIARNIGIEVVRGIDLMTAGDIDLESRRDWPSDSKRYWPSYNNIITLLPFFIEMLQYDWLWSGHMIIKEMFYILIKLKPELALASMTTSDVNNQWHSNFQQQII